MVNNINVFEKEIKDSFIFNIPHASTRVPNMVGYVDVSSILSEIQLLTDWEVDKIFEVEGVSRMVADFSRVFCDVERFADDSKEIMANVGMGVVYTTRDNGEPLRFLTDKVKNSIIKEFYKPYHGRFERMVTKKLKTYGVAKIVDCHSFSDVPFQRDLNQLPNRPDICIGTDEFHTPNYLTDFFVRGFENMGFTVKVNSPYGGSIVPMKYFHKNKNVESIMIEINRNLYMDGDVVKVDKVLGLKNVINEIFTF